MTIVLLRQIVVYMDRLRLVTKSLLTTTVFLDGGRAAIKLHDQVRIAAYCHLYAFDHGMQLDRPLYQQPVRSQGIEIEKDVWLGAHVGVKDGIKIGKHAVVGMNSMVTKDVEPYHIVGGNPAKFIRLRE